MTAPAPRLGLGARYLSIWVAGAMVGGVALGKGLPVVSGALRGMEFGGSGHVNAPIAILIWLMIVPMMMKVDVGAIRDVGRRPRGLLVTLFVNWLVKPFSMAFLAWLFFKQLFAGWIGPDLADQYMAGSGRSYCLLPSRSRRARCCASGSSAGAARTGSREGSCPGSPL